MPIATELSERIALIYKVTKGHECISFTSYITAGFAEGMRSGCSCFPFFDDYCHPCPLKPHGSSGGAQGGSERGGEMMPSPFPTHKWKPF